MLAWGETDVFRLLDNINPLDDSFGGFFIALDERRVPIAMVRSSWQIGSYGPFQDAFAEGFVAQGNRVATNPGIQLGSTWIPGGHRVPEPSPSGRSSPRPRPPTSAVARASSSPPRTSPGRWRTTTRISTCRGRSSASRRVRTLPDGTTIGPTPSFQNPILAYQQFPRVTITGGSATFPIPSLYTIVRSEVAYFAHQPFSRQGTGDTADSFAGANSSPGPRG